MAKRKVKIYQAIIPSAFGYGVEVYGATARDAMRNMYHEFLEWVDGWKADFTFTYGWEYFSGSLRLLTEDDKGAEGDCGTHIDVEVDDIFIRIKEKGKKIECIYISELEIEREVKSACKAVEQ